jgi:hypothetical protein
MIALRLVRGVTGHFVGRWPEWILSAILFSLGCKLLGSGDTFASGSGFNVMAKVATEEHWGIFLCSVSGARLVALVINGTFAPFARLSPIVRSALGAMSGFAWFAIALGQPGGLGLPDLLGPPRCRHDKRNARGRGRRRLRTEIPAWPQRITRPGSSPYRGRSS